MTDTTYAAFLVLVAATSVLIFGYHLLDWMGAIPWQ